MTEKHIAVLDFGSQYMHLITRRIRQLGVLANIYPTDVPASELAGKVWGVILSGGPQSVTDSSLTYDPAIFDLPVPVLGLCYGHQLMAHHYGGVVTPAHNREYGIATFHRQGDSALLTDVPEYSQVWMSHWDSVTSVPDGFSIIGATDDCPVAAMANETSHRYGLQFHSEVQHTTAGMQILSNFVLGICGAEKNWSMKQYVQELNKTITHQVGKRNVVLFVSGGVDSVVAFALLEKIVGKERVLGLHVDHGFMRHNESAEVQQALAAAGFDNLHVINAQDQFAHALAGLIDPEEKRKAIGKAFIDIQHQAMKDLDLSHDEWMLGQGTIYPDTIETGGTKTSDTIKTHHNRVDEIMKLIEQGRVIEPLAELYKDEVRELGRQLQLPNHIVERWPFPGPGLAIRLLCSDGLTVDVPTQAQQEVQTLAQAAGAYSGCILPVRSVGVQGDQRSYQHPALLYTTNPNQTLDWDVLNDLSVRITNTVHGVNRVVFELWNRTNCSGVRTPEEYPELFAAQVNAQRADRLRQAELIVTTIIDNHKLNDEIWQFPLVLLPLRYGQSDRETLVLRPIQSQEAMTVNFYAMPEVVVREIIAQLSTLDWLDAILYDITNKPPATIEWE